jgi:hypothetical protein
MFLKLVVVALALVALSVPAVRNVLVANALAVLAASIPACVLIGLALHNREFLVRWTTKAIVLSFPFIVVALTVASFLYGLNVFIYGVKGAPWSLAHCVLFALAITGFMAAVVITWFDINALVPERVQAYTTHSVVSVDRDLEPVAVPDAEGEINIPHEQVRPWVYEQSPYWRELVQEAKAHFDCSEDDEATRKVVRRWIFNRASEQKVRPSHIAAHINKTVELCFIPSLAEIEARQMRQSRIAQERRTQFARKWMSNDTWTRWFGPGPN